MTAGLIAGHHDIERYPPNSGGDFFLRVCAARYWVVDDRHSDRVTGRPYPRMMPDEERPPSVFLAVFDCAGADFSAFRGNVSR